MNKSAIARIIIWSVVAVLIGGFLVSALAFDTFGTIFDHFNIGFSSLRYDEEKYSKGNFTAEDEIETYKIYWIAGEIDISFYDGSVIRAEESSEHQIDDDNTMRYLIEDGVLTIRARKPGFSFRFGRKEQKRLTLQIPQALTGRVSLILVDSVSARVSLSDLSAEKFRLDNVSGNVMLRNAAFESMDLDTVSGNINCSDVTAALLKIDTVSGRCNFTGSVKKINFDSVSGGIYVDSSQFPEEIRTDTVSGGATFKIPAEGGFTAHLDSVSGDLNCNASVISNGKSRKYGDGSAKYDFDSVSGDVSIHIKEKAKTD